MSGLIEGILAAHAAGDRDDRRPDHVAFGGEAAPLVLAAFAALSRGGRVARPTLAAVLSENAVGAFDPRPSAGRLARMAAACGIETLPPGGGALEWTVLERLAGPGRFLLAAEPGLPATGAVATLAWPAGELELAAAMTGAPHRLRPPWRTTVHLTGIPAAWVGGEDVASALAVALGGGRRPEVLEIGGEGLRMLPVADRIAIASRAPTLGVRTVLFASDEATRAWLDARGREPDWKRLEVGPPDLALELAAIEPMLAGPERPELPRLVRRTAGVRVAEVVLGPRLTALDLERAAAWIGARPLAPGVRMTVIAGSRSRRAAAREPLAALTRAGVRTAPTETWPRRRPLAGVGLACGVDAATLSALDGSWYLASAATCAASAVLGAVTDPRAAEAPPPAGDPDLVRDPPQRPVPVTAAAESPQPLPVPRRFAGSVRGIVLAVIGRDGERLPAAATGPRTVGRDQAFERIARDSVDPGLAARASRHGGGWLVGGTRFGAGVRSDAPAATLACLGVRGVLARSFAPELERGLARAGVLPLVVEGEADLARLGAGDELEIAGLPDCLGPARSVVVRNLTRGLTCVAGHRLEPAMARLVAEGGIVGAAQAVP